LRPHELHDDALKLRAHGGLLGWRGSAAASRRRRLDRAIRVVFLGAGEER